MQANISKNNKLNLNFHSLSINPTNLTGAWLRSFILMGGIKHKLLSGGILSKLATFAMII